MVLSSEYNSGIIGLLANFPGFNQRTVLPDLPKWNRGENWRRILHAVTQPTASKDV